MKVIALLTDFGLNDNYVGVIKGVILKINPDARIVDISHNISSHNIKDAAFLLVSSFSYFPKGSVFLSVVDPGVGSGRKPIAIKTKNYYFIGPDNGSLSIAAGVDGIEKILALENKRYFLPEVSLAPLEKAYPVRKCNFLTGFTFQGRDVFAPAAAHLSGKVSFSSLGRAVEKIEKIDLPYPKVKGKLIEGEIIYIDKFGNLITNIKNNYYKRLAEGRFIAVLKKKKIEKICFYYAKNKTDEPFFVMGGFGYLEISVKDKSAKEYFAIKDKEKTKLTFSLKIL